MKLRRHLLLVLIIRGVSCLFFNYFFSGAFPADDELVSLDLLRACAAVKGSKWEDIGVFLIGSDDLDDIRRAYGGNVVRMFKVLESWNMAKSPSVGQLLAWFEEVGVNRSHIERKYNELYASK